MRKFKFVGDPLNKNDLKVGKIYPKEFQYMAKNDPDSWQEVTDQPNRIPNQDMPASSMTKFEMAVFMVLQGLVSNPNTARQIQSTIGRGPTAEESNRLVSNTAIALVKETFKKLENETGRH